MKNFVKNIIPALLLLTSLCIFWEIYARSGLISKRILPSPTKVIESLFESREVILTHAVQTTLETVIGFLLAIVFGVLIALSIFYSTKVKSAIYPLLVISQTIPLIALAPLFIIWFGFGLLPKVFIVMLYCFFPIAVALSDALANTPKHYHDLLISMGANKLQILRHVNAPFALDSFFAGLKISATYAVTGAIVGEYVGAYKGLGVYMQTSASSHAINLVFASILVVILLTMILLGLVFALQKIMMPWKKYET